MTTTQDIINKLLKSKNNNISRPIENILTPQRIEKLERLISQNKFEDTLYRLVLEHNNQDYKEKFYHNGFYDVEPNNKLGFLLLYIVVIGGEPINHKDYNNNKTGVLTWLYENYFFQFIYNIKENFVNLHVFTSEKNGYKKILSL